MVGRATRATLKRTVAIPAASKRQRLFAVRLVKSKGISQFAGQDPGSIPPSLPRVTVTLTVVVAMIHLGRTALPIIPDATVAIERVAGSVVLAVRVRIILRAVPGILDDGLRSRWTCERCCQQRCAKYPCAKDCKFCHERPRKFGFSGRTPRLRACSPACSPVPSHFPDRRGWRRARPMRQQKPRPDALPVNMIRQRGSC
jgi:hypothetical protein